jgi:hypothetical protein
LFRTRVLGEPISQFVPLEVDGHAKAGEVTNSTSVVVVQV